MSFFVKQSAAAGLVWMALSAHAQYSTSVGTGAAKPKTLRATAVLEWTGALEKPSASRLMPIAVWDGEQYQPAGLYMAQPEPLAFAAGTQYELERSGESAGLFEVRTAAQLRGQWIGMGKFEPEAPPPPPKKLKVSKQLPVLAGGKSTADDSRPTLHRKDDAGGGPTSEDKGSGSGAASANKAPAGAPDATAPAKTSAPDQAGAGGGDSAGSDRPTLHRRTGAGDASASGDESGSASSTAGGKAPPDADPDRPILHKHEDKSADGGGTADTDPDRPTLHRARSNTASFTSASVDPDRPHLRYGLPTEPGSLLLPPKLEGAPPQMQQIVAVSDSAVGDPQRYQYQWASPDDAAKMKAAMALIAAKAVVRPSAAATAVPGGQTKFGPAVRASARKGAKAASALPSLVDEKFVAYELSFSGGATVVYTAHTPEEGAQRVYVTLIAQPDFNGNPQVLLQQVARGDRLDETPAMQLVDAVDTDDDRRAELVFELTGGPVTLTQGGDASVSFAPVAEREFAIYKVAGGRVSQVFTTGPLP